MSARVGQRERWPRVGHDLGCTGMGVSSKKNKMHRLAASHNYWVFSFSTQAARELVRCQLLVGVGLVTNIVARRNSMSRGDDQRRLIVASLDTGEVFLWLPRQSTLRTVELSLASVLACDVKDIVLLDGANVLRSDADWAGFKEDTVTFIRNKTNTRAGSSDLSGLVRCCVTHVATMTLNTNDKRTHKQSCVRGNFAKGRLDHARPYQMEVFRWIEDSPLTGADVLWMRSNGGVGQTTMRTAMVNRYGPGQIYVASSRGSQGGFDLEACRGYQGEHVIILDDARPNVHRRHCSDSQEALHWHASRMLFISTLTHGLRIEFCGTPATSITPFAKIIVDSAFGFSSGCDYAGRYDMMNIDSATYKCEWKKGQNHCGKIPTGIWIRPLAELPRARSYCLVKEAVTGAGIVMKEHYEAQDTLGNNAGISGCVCYAKRIA